MGKSPSKLSVTTTASTPSVTTTASTLSVDSPSKSLPARPSEFSPIVKAANAALMERSHFAIDDATGDDDTDDESERGADDNQVMDEVCFFSRSSLLKNRLADLFSPLRLMHSWRRTTPV